MLAYRADVSLTNNPFELQLESQWISTKIPMLQKQGTPQNHKTYDINKLISIFFTTSSIGIFTLYSFSKARIKLTKTIESK